METHLESAKRIVQDIQSAYKGKFEGRLKAETSSPLMPALELAVHGKVE